MSTKRASAQQIQDEINFFGGIAPMLAKATPGELLDIYSSMQLRLIYQPGVSDSESPGNARGV